MARVSGFKEGCPLVGVRLDTQLEVFDSPRQGAYNGPRPGRISISNLLMVSWEATRCSRTPTSLNATMMRPEDFRPRVGPSRIEQDNLPRLIRRTLYSSYAAEGCAIEISKSAVPQRLWQ